MLYTKDHSPHRQLRVEARIHEPFKLSDIMLYKVCTEVQAINTYISSKPYNSYAKQMQKSRFAIPSKQWEKSKNPWNALKQHFFFLEKVWSFMGPPTFLHNMHNYQNTDQAFQKTPKNLNSIFKAIAVLEVFLV